MKTIGYTIIIVAGFSIIAGFSSFSHAQEQVPVVKTVAPDPNNTLNSGVPLTSFNPFDAGSYSNLFKKKETQTAHAGRLAYSTGNSVHYGFERIDVEKDFQNYDDTYRSTNTKGTIVKVRAPRPNNGVASVGQAGVILARDGQLNYGVLVLFVLLLAGVIILARFTIRKGRRGNFYPPRRVVNQNLYYQRGPQAVYPREQYVQAPYDLYPQPRPQARYYR